MADRIDQQHMGAKSKLTRLLWILRIPTEAAARQPPAAVQSGTLARLVVGFWTAVWVCIHAKRRCGSANETFQRLRGRSRDSLSCCCVTS